MMYGLENYRVLAKNMNEQIYQTFKTIYSSQELQTSFTQHNTADQTMGKICRSTLHTHI